MDGKSFVIYNHNSILNKKYNLFKIYNGNMILIKATTGEMRAIKIEKTL